MNDPSQICSRIYAFLHEIGLGVVETTLTEATFLPGILIDGGQLKVDPRQLRYPTQATCCTRQAILP